MGKINSPLNIRFRIKCHLETDMKKLSESKKKVIAIGAADVKTIFKKTPFLQYELFLVDKNFTQYLEAIMVSKKTYGWACKEHPSKRHMKCQSILTQLP